MNEFDAISCAVLAAMPGWDFVSPLRAFGWTPRRHFRAVLAKAGKRQRVIVRHSWSVLGFDTEKCLYESVLGDMSFRTPVLLGTFAIDHGEPPWMILEDLGESTIADEPAKRHLILPVLGLLHGCGRHLLEAGRLDTGKLVPFPGSHTCHDEWETFLGDGLTSDRYALPSGVLGCLDRLRDGLAQEPQTLLHGDTDLSNFVLTADGVAPVDWERALIGPASLDLGSVVSLDKLSEDMQSYRVAYCQASGHSMGNEDALRVGGQGILFDSLRWVCYYIRRVEAGNDPGEEWRQLHYEPRLRRVRAVTRLSG